MMKNIFLLVFCSIALPAHAAESAVGLKKIERCFKDLDKLELWAYELDLLDSRHKECIATIKHNGITPHTKKRLSELKESATNFLDNCNHDDYRKKAGHIIRFCDAKLYPTLQGMPGNFKYLLKDR